MTDAATKLMDRTRRAFLDKAFERYPAASEVVVIDHVTKARLFGISRNNILPRKTIVLHFDGRTLFEYKPVSFK